MLPLYPGAEPCVGSGFCCKKGPCAYGESIGPDNPRCKHLQEVPQDDGLHPRYTCGIYDEIVKQPFWEHNPAFGAGCCSSLFNPDRAAILRDIRSGAAHDVHVRGAGGDDHER